MRTEYSTHVGAAGVENGKMTESYACAPGRVCVAEAFRAGNVIKENDIRREFFPPNPLPPPPGSFGKSGKSSRALARCKCNIRTQCEMVTDASGFVIAG